MAQKFELELVIKNAQAAATVGDVKEQLKQLKNAMLQVGEDSAEFQQLANEAAKLKDRVEEANEAIANMNPDQFKGLQQMASGAATGVQLVTSSMALLGVESQDAQKAMMRVQAAMSFADSINNIDKLKKAWKAFTAAVSANPIVAVVAALALLAGAIYKIYEAQQDANSELAKATREYEKQQEVTASLSRQYEREIELLTAQGASTEEIIAAKRKLILTQIDEVRASIAVHEKTLQEIKDNDTLWESILRVADASGLSNDADLLLAQNKKERRDEELSALNDQKEALKDLEYSLLVLDAEEQKANEDKVKSYKDANKSKVDDQKVTDDELSWEAQQLADELIAIEQAKNDELDRIEAEHQAHRFELYKEDQRRTQELEDKKLALKKKAAERARKIDELENQLKLQAAQTVLGAVGELFKDNANAQKAVGAATTLIDTYIAAQKAFTSQILPADPTSVGRGYIAAGLAVAAGLARVAAILRVDTNGGSVNASGGMGGGNTGSLQVSSQPNVSSGSQPSTLLNEQGQVINQQQQSQMYVSVTEINQVGGVVEAIEQRNRF